MKKLILIQLFLLFPIFLIAQKFHEREFRVNIRNNYGNATISADLENVDWEESWAANTYNFDEHNLWTFIPIRKYTTQNNVNIGWYICWKAISNDSFGLANYKVIVRTDGQTTDYFFIDYRTSDLPESYNSTEDIDIYLNVNNGLLYWDYSLTQLIGTNTQFTIWDLSEIISCKTTELEPYTTLSFNIGGNQYPQLTWTHYPKGYRTGYAIYRSVVSG
jgi:hypothetical protein